MTPLYELAAAYRSDFDKLESLDIDEETMRDTLEGMGGELIDKVQNVVFYAKNLEATAIAMKAAEEGMAKRRKATETKIEGLLRYAKESMEFAGLAKVEGIFLKISIAKTPTAVEIFDLELLPAQYMRQPATPPPTPDKVAIKAAINAGDEVSGARLKSGTRLNIS